MTTLTARHSHRLTSGGTAEAYSRSLVAALLRCALCVSAVRVQIHHRNSESNERRYPNSYNCTSKNSSPLEMPARSKASLDREKQTYRRVSLLVLQQAHNEMKLANRKK
jgi:hypothetical protein